MRASARLGVKQTNEFQQRSWSYTLYIPNGESSAEFTEFFKQVTITYSVKSTKILKTVKSNFYQLFLLYYCSGVTSWPSSSLRLEPMHSVISMFFKNLLR